MPANRLRHCLLRLTAIRTKWRRQTLTRHGAGGEFLTDISHRVNTNRHSCSYLNTQFSNVANYEIKYRHTFYNLLSPPTGRRRTLLICFYIAPHSPFLLSEATRLSRGGFSCFCFALWLHWLLEWKRLVKL